MSNQSINSRKGSGGSGGGGGSKRGSTGSIQTLSQTPSRLQNAKSPKKLEKRDTLDKIQVMNPAERVLLQLISSGEKEDIQKLIGEQRYKSQIDITKHDLDGLSILGKAIATKDAEIVKILLDQFGHGIDVDEPLMICVKEGGGEEIFGELMKYSKDKIGSQWSIRNQNYQLGDEYHGKISPFQMAAYLGDYDMMEKIWTERMELMPAIHYPSCTCHLCKHAPRQVEISLTRIHLLEAKCNPVYLLFMNQTVLKFDPVFESFMLVKSIKKCLVEEPEYKDHYEKLLEKAVTLVTEMVDNCMSLEEMEIFLSPDTGLRGGWFSKFCPRLSFAIYQDQKEFVSNPNVQFYLQTEFTGEPWYPRTSFEQMIKYVIQLAMVALFWFYNAVSWVCTFCLCSSADPATWYGLSPVNRCLGKLGSHLYFCGVLIALCIMEVPEGPVELHILILKAVIYLYVIAYFVKLVKQMCSAVDIRLFITRGWNLFDTILLLLYVSYFLSTLLDYHHHYFNVKPRRALSSWDPILISDSIFAIATTFTVLRTVRWYILLPSVGPLQVAMGRMGSNLKTILVFFLWTLLTFSVGTTILYRPYKNLKEGTKTQPMHITDFKMQFLTWFKSGKIGPKETQLLVPKGKFVDPSTGEVTEKENPQQTTQFFITFICIAFNIIVASFLRSSVVAFFGSSQKMVLEAKDVEWKYLRAQEWLYYIQDFTLAPPFNLIPNGLTIRDCFKKAARKRALERLADQMEEQYPKLMRILLQRILKRSVNKKKGYDDDDD